MELKNTNYLSLSLTCALLFLSSTKNRTPSTSVCSEEMKKEYKFHFDDTCGGARLNSPRFYSEERPIYMGIFFENGDTIAYAEKKELEWKGLEGEDSLVAALTIDIDSDLPGYRKLQKMTDANRRVNLVLVAGLPTDKGIKHLRFCFLVCPISMFSFQQLIIWAHISRYNEEFYSGYQQFVKRYERYLRGEITREELY